jgi:HSP20 family protein
LVTKRWDPVRDLLTLQERMNRLFEESLSRGRPQEPALDARGWQPLADAYEAPDNFVVMIEIPGLSEDEVELQVEADQLVVRGERRLEAQARADSFHRMERSYGTFARTFRFGTDVDPERIGVQFRDGLLRVELPKAFPRGTWRSRRESSE